VESYIFTVEITDAIAVATFEKQLKRQLVVQLLGHRHHTIMFTGSNLASLSVNKHSIVVVIFESPITSAEFCDNLIRRVNTNQSVLNTI
jgi:hypothetical protein